MKLGEIVNINIGQSPRSEFYNSRGEGMPFYQGVTDFGEKYPKKSTYCSRPTKIAEVGDIFFSVRAPVGDVNVAIEKSCIGRGVAALRMKNGNNDFLYFFLKNYERYFKGISGGTTYESINKDQLEDIEFIIPSDLNEQKRIAFILSAFDDKIELNNKISWTLEQIAQAIFKEWFVKFKFPGHEKVKMVDSELGKIPEGWEVKRFGELLKLKHGYGFKSEEFGEERTNRILVRMGNFKETGGLQFDDNTKYLKSDTYNKKDQLLPNDLVMVLSDITRDGRIIGRVGLIPKDERVYLLNQRVAKIEMEEKFKLFLFFYFNSKKFKEHCLSRADSATVLNLKNDHIYEIKMAIPEDNILDEFNGLVLPVFKKSREIENENQKLTALRDLLLPKLMSGEIKV